MGILKSAADVVYTIRFLKLLVTPIEETEAYKAGIVDENGKKRRDFDRNSLENREAYRRHYTTFHRLVFNLKKIMAKAPGGRSVLARYGAALALIKEHGELSDSNLYKIHDKTGIDFDHVLSEQSQWFILENNQLSPGMYKMKCEALTLDTYDDLVKKDDKIRITEENSMPYSDIFDVPVYKAIHCKSNQTVLVTTSEITK